MRSSLSNARREVPLEPQSSVNEVNYVFPTSSHSEAPSPESGPYFMCPQSADAPPSIQLANVDEGGLPVQQSGEGASSVGGEENQEGERSPSDRDEEEGQGQVAACDGLGIGEVSVPENGSWFAKMRAFAGPGSLIAVGYMDPGNWATDIAGGSAFNNQLLFVIASSSILAMFFQALALRLGLVARLDLARMCKMHFSWPVSFALWLTAEVAIMATDLAEVVGSAIALNMLFGMPLLWGVLFTAADVLLLIFFGLENIKRMEILIVALCTTVAVCLIVELGMARPDGLDVLYHTFVPPQELFSNREMLTISIGIIGATIMPHNLYLHSSLVLTRSFANTPGELESSVRFSMIDSCTSLLLACFVNAAILMLAAATFFRQGMTTMADLQEAYVMLGSILGAKAGSVLFGVALLAAGQQSTITGTLAGQIVMEGFLGMRLPSWQRRLITRLLAIVPAVVSILVVGEQSVNDLLVISQVILSFQLPFAVFPLVMFTGNEKIMGPFTNRWYVRIFSWLAAMLLTVLNVILLFQTFVPESPSTPTKPVEP